MAKNPAESSEQGSFFTETGETSGVTDPALQTQSTQLEPTPEGVYPDQIAASTGPQLPNDPELLAKVRKQVETHRHRTAQTGRHSPLERDGNYQGVKPGDVLPDGFIVAKSNIEEARRRAEDLEARRHQ